MVSETISIIDFISRRNLTFTIPVYQRNYSWSTENCEKMFEDLIRAYESGREHYFGNIVYYVIDNKLASNYSNLALIDGQQRITTTMLLIAAIRDCEENEESRNSITQNYLLNANGDEANKVKLKQIEGDRDSYEAIITNAPTQNIASNAVRNYKKFKTLVKNSGYTSDELLAALMKFRVIALNLQLNENGGALTEKPQIIFESINATGRPLSDADLLRNYLLLDIPDDEQENAYKNYWLQIERNIPQSGDITDFLNRYLIMRTNDPVQRKSEYVTFKKNFAKLFGVEQDANSAYKALKDLLKYSRYYKWIKDPINTEEIKNYSIAKQLASMNEARSDYATPVFLYLAEKADNPEITDFSMDDFCDTLNIIESWLFRARIVQNIGTGNIGQISRSLLSVVKNTTDHHYKDAIYYELSNNRFEDVWPNDESFKAAFVKYDFYNRYKNYVMRKLENNISYDRINETPASIEHVLPQTLTPYWKNILGENAVELHARYVNTIGNLAPLNQHDNTINSNDTYENKAEQLSSSSWMLTREIPAKYSNWNIETIEKRANELAEVATKVWIAPLPRERMIEANTRSHLGRKSRDLSNIPDGTVFQLQKTAKGVSVDAKMTVVKEGEEYAFVLLAGSIIALDGDDGFVRKRKTATGDESFLTERGGRYFTNRDISFLGSSCNTPSGIASSCTMSPEPGWAVWVDIDTGKTLDQIARGEAAVQEDEE